MPPCGTTKKPLTLMETGFDFRETKLLSYWNTSFSKICFGMKIDQQINISL